MEKCIEKAESYCKSYPRCYGCGAYREPTNADRIRAMSDDELAAWLVEKTVYQESAFSPPSYLNFLTESDDTKKGAIEGTLEWLKHPVKDGDNNG